MHKKSDPCAKAKALALPEIFEHISTFLPRQDLLNCRLVNKQWNNEARKMITEKIPFFFISDAWKFKKRRLREQFIDLMAPSRPPLFSNFIMGDLRSFESSLFTLISQSIKSLTFEYEASGQNRALDLILLHCPNLEYLHFTTCFYPCKSFAAHSSLIRTSPAPKVNKLKFLTIKLWSGNIKLNEEEYKLVSNLLAHSPYLEELTLQSAGQEMPEHILSAVKEQIPQLEYLKYLCVDYRLSNPREHLQHLLNQKFKLTKLRLNESCTEILDLVLVYQPRVASVELSVRDFGWTDLLVINRQVQKYCVRELEISLIDFDNQYVHFKNQFRLKIIRAHSSRRGENFVAIIEEFESRENTPTFFQLDAQNYMVAQPNMLHTLRAINLGYVLANIQTIAFLSEFSGLTKLTVLPAFPGVIRSIWSHLPGLEELVIYVHPNIRSYLHLELAITGLPYPSRYNIDYPNIDYPNIDWHPGCGSEAEMLELVHKKRDARASICICNLRRLRSLEIVNTREKLFITQTSIFTCFLKMNSLTCLKFPYVGSPVPLQYLQLKFPSMYLEASERMY